MTLAVLVAALVLGAAPPTGAATVPAGGVAADRCFVDAAHQTFLERPPTPQELQTWLAAFDAGAARHVLVGELAGSDEWLAVTVEGIYALALDRPADPLGLAYWVARLRAGALVNEVGAAVFGSAEFHARMGGTDAGFVAGLYELILQRVPGADETAYWVGQVGPRGRSGVAAEFYASYESRAMRVDDLYDRLLGRDPAPADLTYWADRLLRVNDVRLAILIASSPEFAARTRVDCPYALVHGTISLVGARQGSPYVQDLVADGGQPPYSWSATGLPPGLAVAGAALTGTPLVVGTHSVTLTVTDADGAAESRTLALVVGPPALRVVSSTLRDARAGVPYAQLVLTGGGTAPRTVTATGLPAGLTLSGGVVSGTTTEVGVATLDVTVTDAVGDRATGEVELEVGDAAVELDMALYHGCAATHGGEARCWGFNPDGRTGTAGGPTPATVPGVSDAVDVAASGSSSCAARADGTVRCWGSDSVGQLGDGAPASGPGAVTVTGLTDVVAVDGEQDSTCALREAGTVACWGTNANGQLGDGTTTNRTAPVGVVGLTDAVQVTVGVSFACAVRATGQVVCWGNGASGRLGDGLSASSPTPVTVSGVTDAVSVSAGLGHACVVRAVGTVRCWGANGDGQIGDGTTTGRATPVAVGGTASTVAVSAGFETTCAVRANGTVRCWGSPERGGLGQGSIAADDQLTPLLVPGLVDARAPIDLGDGNAAVGGDAGVRLWGQNGAGQAGVSGAGDVLSPTLRPGL